MTLDQVQARIRKLTRVNLKVAEYLRVCDITHRAVDGGPCQDPKCKAIARKYQENEEEILRLLDLKYEMLPTGETYNVISSLLSQ
ncbi:hypothetical protein [Synechococcus phage S-H34]|uniref:Uncharacterized protein n=1 Tax=Synechococcus phage S-H34 TaxID=2718942 RepID=A0A6G8R6H1_9CAUD|nr:hypothetical protein PQC15_gp113 [Synechococcus phage S-H34]QIN96984.1 hypothetical protein [Synechococcus phage S-H34]